MTILLVPLEGTSAFGELFEHFIICEFKTLIAYKKPRWEMYYFQSATGNEIDLILDTGMGDPILIEIKSARSIGKLNLGSTLQLMAEFKFSRNYVLSQDPIKQSLSEHVTAMHWSEGLKEIFGDEI